MTKAQVIKEMISLCKENSFDISNWYRYDYAKGKHIKRYSIYNGVTTESHYADTYEECLKKVKKAVKAAK
jgi:hypothetical protein